MSFRVEDLGLYVSLYTNQLTTNISLHVNQIPLVAVIPSTMQTSMVNTRTGAHGSGPVSGLRVARVLNLRVRAQRCLRIEADEGHERWSLARAD